MSIVGIDFGTSCNKVACLNKYGLKILQNSNKNSNTPSVALFAADDEWIFGEQAVKYSQKNQGQLICNTKIMLGRDFNDPIIKKLQKECNFKIKKCDNGIKIIVEADNKPYEFSPLEITEKIFTNLLKVTKLYSIIPDSTLIISIPTLYDKKQTEELTKVCHSAKFPKFEFIKEPVLASIAYLSNIKVEPNQNQNIIVFNFGMYYLDVSIIKIHDKGYELVTELNGKISSKQIDLNIFNHILSTMKAKYTDRIDFFNRPDIQSKLLQKCEYAKIALSELDKANITLNCEDNSKINYILTIKTFNRLNSQLFDNIKETVKTAIKKANLQIEDINHLFLVGGCTLIKKIQSTLIETIGIEPSPYVDPKEAIALGACIAGKAISNKSVIDILVQPEISNQQQSINDNAKIQKIVPSSKEKITLATPCNITSKSLEKQGNDNLGFLKKSPQNNKKLIRFLNNNFERELVDKLSSIIEKDQIQISSKIESCIREVKNYYESKIQKISAERDQLRQEKEEIINNTGNFINNISNELFDKPYQSNDVLNNESQQNFVNKCTEVKDILNLCNELKNETKQYQNSIKDHYIKKIQILKEINHSLQEDINSSRFECRQLEIDKNEIINFTYDTFFSISIGYSLEIESFKKYIIKLKSKIQDIINQDEEIRKLVNADQNIKTLDAVKFFKDFWINKRWNL